MIRRLTVAALVVLAVFNIAQAQAQQTVSFKNFTAFRNIVPGIDFYASSRQVLAPYEQPIAEGVAKLQKLLGTDLPKGAVFICSTLEQRDSVYEPKVLKSGYSWTLTTVTSEARTQEMLARIKSQMGGEIPAEIKERMQRMQSEMTAQVQKQAVTTLMQQIALAITQTMFDRELQFRSSRVDDVGKSPLPDWLDMGIAIYASGVNPTASYLKQNMDQTFPIEDILSMARPFVASSARQDGGGGMGRPTGPGGGNGNNNFGGPGAGGFPGGFGAGGGFPGGMPPAGGGFPSGAQAGGGSRGMGGFGGAGGMGGSRGGPQRQMSKDEQDRMLFDGQASTFFSYLLEKIGLEKVKELIKQAQEGRESREYLGRPDVLGSDFEKIEQDWVEWVKAKA